MYMYKIQADMAASCVRCQQTAGKFSLSVIHLDNCLALCSRRL